MNTYNFTAMQLQDVYILSNNITRSDAALAAMKAVNNELCSLNRVLKTMKGATVYNLLKEELAKVGVTDSKQLTITGIHALVPDSLKKQVITKKEDGTEEVKTVLCTVRRKYETDTAFLYDEQGRKLAKKVVKKDGTEEFVPRTQKVVRIDEDGDKVVKGYQLCQINTWSIGTMLELLANAEVIRREKIEAAEVEQAEAESK